MSNITPVKKVQVGINFGSDVMPVGRLAMRERTIYFEYDRAFIERGLEISPFRLPLKSGVSRFDYDTFEGLLGVFNDSLPDGWGRLLFDRFARTQGIVPSKVTPLDRLAHIGMHGMGALVFEPDYNANDAHDTINLDNLAKQAQDVLEGDSDEVLQELLSLNGSSAGARPKALIGVNQARTHIAWCQ
ncbi:MAG: HipA N-terminal domain-containing protein [Devosiaceae bacterium]|nr:HipA N-terminal domain-containing protein [Devosiaceae bacterium]